MIIAFNIHPLAERRGSSAHLAAEVVKWARLGGDQAGVGGTAPRSAEASRIDSPDGAAERTGGGKGDRNRVFRFGEVEVEGKAGNTVRSGADPVQVLFATRDLPEFEPEDGPPGEEWTILILASAPFGNSADDGAEVGDNGRTRKILGGPGGGHLGQRDFTKPTKAGSREAVFEGDEARETVPPSLCPSLPLFHAPYGSAVCALSAGVGPAEVWSTVLDLPEFEPKDGPPGEDGNAFLPAPVFSGNLSNNGAGIDDNDLAGELLGPQGGGHHEKQGMLFKQVTFDTENIIENLTKLKKNLKKKHLCAFVKVGGRVEKNRLGFGGWMGGETSYQKDVAIDKIPEIKTGHHGKTQRKGDSIEFYLENELLAGGVTSILKQSQNDSQLYATKYGAVAKAGGNGNNYHEGLLETPKVGAEQKVKHANSVSTCGSNRKQRALSAVIVCKFRTLSIISCLVASVLCADTQKLSETNVVLQDMNRGKLSSMNKHNKVTDKYEGLLAKVATLVEGIQLDGGKVVASDEDDTIDDVSFSKWKKVATAKEGMSPMAEGEDTREASTKRANIDASNVDIHSLDEGLKLLKKLNRASLRGTKDDDLAAVMTEVRHVVKSQLDSVSSIQKHLQNGDKEKAGATLKSMVRDTGAVAEMNKEVGIIDALPDSSDQKPLSLSEIPNDQLAQFIPSQVNDMIVEHSQDLHQFLGYIADSTFSQFESDSFEFGAAGESDFFQSNPKKRANLNHFSKIPHTPKASFRHHKTSRSSSSFKPKLSTFSNSHNNDIVMAKHQLRLDALGDSCPVKCDLENHICLCERLFGCVNEMSEYDLAGLVTGGFVDTNPSSNTFGNFTVPVEQLQLYNAEQELSVKLRSIKAQADDANTANKIVCNAVLRDLFSACNPEDTTCQNPNVQSFPVSVEQVCAAVNTPKKILFEAIGDEFDGFADKFLKPPCAPLSYDTCAAFVVEFDRLYAGRNIDEYHEDNPMRILDDSSVSPNGLDQLSKVDLFGQVQFPVRYSFPQDPTTGVVTYDFPSKATAKYFHLVNPSNGKVLGLVDGSMSGCAGSSVQTQDYKKDNLFQQFFLTDEGYLQSRGCTNQVLSGVVNTSEGIDSCRHGSALVLRNISAESPKWYLGTVNQSCDEVCGAQRLQCTANSRAKQTALSPENDDGALEAFRAAGSTCTSFPLTREYAGSPFMTHDGRCVNFGTNNRSISSKQSVCTSQKYPHRALCYCEASSEVGQVGSGGVAVQDGKIKNDHQRWTIRKDGTIVNNKCGQWKGNLAISAIADDTVKKLDDTDSIPVQFMNPESNKVIGLEGVTNCENEKKVKLQSKAHPTKNSKAFDLPHVPTSNSGDTSFEVSKEDAGDFGIGDFSIEMDVTGKGFPIADTGHTYGTLFIRSGEAGAPFSGPSVFIFNNGNVIFRLRSDEAFTFAGAMPNPEEVITRRLVFSRTGSTLQAVIDGTQHTHAITKDIVDIAALKGAPLRFRGNHVDKTTQSLYMEVTNIIMSSLENLQSFFLKRVADEIWEIHSQCEGKVLEIASDDACKVGDEVQLYDKFERKKYKNFDAASDGTCLDIDGHEYEGVSTTRCSGNSCYSSNNFVEEDYCFEFCKSLSGTENQVAVQIDDEGCTCLYDYQTRPSACAEKENRFYPWTHTECYAFCGTQQEGCLPRSGNNFGEVRTESGTGRGPVASSREDDDNDGYHIRCVPLTFAPTPIATRTDRRNQWKFKSGKIESVKCKGMVMEIQPASVADGASIVLAQKNEKGWNQDWSIISNSVRLLTGDSSLDQQWYADFVGSAYNFALLPGFPGGADDQGCLSSRDNKELAKSAMYSCDVSMALLLGSSTSVGTLRETAALVNSEGSGRMPGECCLDNAVESSFFGHRYDPTLVDSLGNKMVCQNRGLWHLGISEEACENAGGTWFRTPCVTLQQCIDRRPSRFDLADPQSGHCHDMSTLHLNKVEQMNTAFVSSSRYWSSCLEFCQSLPDYPLQAGMEVKELEQGDEVTFIHSESNTAINIPCHYNRNNSTSNSIFFLKTLSEPGKDYNLGNVNIHSKVCEGEVLTVASDDCNSGGEIQFVPRYDKYSKWRIRNGRIESVECDGMAIEMQATSDTLEPKIVLAKISLEVQSQKWDIKSHVDASCVCHYNNGMAPSKELLPEAAIQSPPIFSLKDPSGKLALGLDPRSNCGAATTAQKGATTTTTTSKPVRIESQKAVSTPHQQFQFTRDGRIVSVACPNKALTASPTAGTQCSESTLSAMDYQYHNGQIQQWTSDSDGRIHNVGCPGLELAAIKSVSSLTSGYFALENPKSHLTIGFEGTCRHNMKLFVQKTTYGSPNQQFYFENGRIVSAMCSHLSLTVGDCNSVSPLELKEAGSVWQFNEEDQTIYSLKCDSFLAISMKQSSVRQYARLLSAQVPKFENNTTSEQVNVDIQNHAISVGAAIVLSQNSTEQNQSWMRKHQQFPNLEGPFVLQNSIGKAITVQERCHHGSGLMLQEVDHQNTSQQFYLGRHGLIISKKCAGLVIAVEDLAGSCSHEEIHSSKDYQSKSYDSDEGEHPHFSDVSFSDTTLQTYQIGKKGMKWKFNKSGGIESVQCLGMILTADSTDIRLQNRTEGNSGQVWIRRNVALLARANPEDLVQGLTGFTTVFSDPSYKNSYVPQLSTSNVQNTKCYRQNQAFNRAFEDFASNIVIKNAADEDECRHAREELGFERDHPFDTEVCHTFKENMCDPFFTELDHMTDTGPLEFAHIEYEEAEYEGVKYEAPEYEDDNPFEPLSLGTPSFEPLSPEMKGKDKLVGLQNKVLWSGHALKLAEYAYDYVNDFFDDTCDAIPEMLFCVNNPLRVACELADSVFSKVAYFVLLAAQVVNSRFSHAYEKGTLGPNEAYSGYYFSKATYQNTYNHYKWNVGALNAIDTNMKIQHTEMRHNLQGRHLEMETHIGQDIFDAQNALGDLIVNAQNANGQRIVDAQNTISEQHNQMLHWMSKKHPDTVCLLYKAQGGSCESFIGPLEEFQENIPLSLHWPKDKLTLTERLEKIETEMTASIAKVEDKVQKMTDSLEDLKGMMLQLMSTTR